MMPPLLAGLCLLIALGAGAATGRAAAATVPPMIKDVVTFVFAKGDKGTYLPLGTGFFVGIEEERPHRGHGYLITARHVLQDKARRFFPSVFIRLNKKAGGAEIIEIPLAGRDAPPVYQHPDPDVDLAVIPMLPNQDRYSFKFIPQAMLLSPERFREAQIREGDDVFFAGLFWQFIGERRNYPMIRFGHVGLVTEEKIPWRSQTGTELLDLFLIEAQSTGGNSGAPVFVYAGNGSESGRGGEKSELRLAGVVKGIFLDPKAVVGGGKNSTALVPENMGVTAVVPVYKLHDILFSPALRAVRMQP